jgi:carbon-monoxide dehydrogenase large subunit
VYDPPNLTYPFGAYLSVVDIDPGTGKIKLRRFIAVDDCGVRINEMIVDGQITGGLAEGLGQALMQVIAFDDDGRCLNASLSEYLLPTALECPPGGFELGATSTPCPHHPIGAKGIGESPGVGSTPCVANAVIDALYQARRITDIELPCTPSRIWRALQTGPQRAPVPPRFW